MLFNNEEIPVDEFTIFPSREMFIVMARDPRLPKGRRAVCKDSYFKNGADAEIHAEAVRKIFPDPEVTIAVAECLI